LVLAFIKSLSLVRISETHSNELLDGLPCFKELPVGEAYFILETENVELGDTSLQLGLWLFHGVALLARQTSRPSLLSER